MLIIAVLSVNTIAPIIGFLENGFLLNSYIETLKMLPIIFVIMLFLINIVVRPIVVHIFSKFVTPDHGFSSRILFETLFTVTVLTLSMSIVSSWVGTKQISMLPFENFFTTWPRNFATAFWIELLFAQPIARFIMKQSHLKQESNNLEAISESI